MNASMISLTRVLAIVYRPFLSASLKKMFRLILASLSALVSIFLGSKPAHSPTFPLPRFLKCPVRETWSQPVVMPFDKSYIRYLQNRHCSLICSRLRASISASRFCLAISSSVVIVTPSIPFRTTAIISPHAAVTFSVTGFMLHVRHQPFKNTVPI